MMNPKLKKKISQKIDSITLKCIKETPLKMRPVKLRKFE
jgi:hypothetical protein